MAGHLQVGKFNALVIYTSGRNIEFTILYLYLLGMY